MGFKYVLNSMNRRKLRTAIIALALTIGVALVGALLALVDTQRQFSVQALGATTGGYDLAVSKSNLAASTFFDVGELQSAVGESYDKIAQALPRIQVSAEGRKPTALDGQAVTIVALDANQDQLVSLADGNTQSGLSGIRIRVGGGGGGGGPRGGGGPSRRRPARRWPRRQVTGGKPNQPIPRTTAPANLAAAFTRPFRARCFWAAPPPVCWA